MKKVLLQLMPSRVDLAEVSEIPGGHLPITKKKITGIVPYRSRKGQKLECT